MLLLVNVIRGWMQRLFASLGAFLRSASTFDSVDRARYFYSVDAYDEALPILTENIDGGTTDTRAHFMRGMILASRGETAAAVEDVTRGIAITPQDAFLYQLRAALYARQEKYEEALADYTTMIEIDSQKLKAFKRRGDEHPAYQDGLSDEWLRRLTDAYQGRGRAYAALGQYEAARADFSEGLYLAPQDALFLMLCTACDIYLEDYQQAIENSTKAVLFLPDTGEQTAVAVCQRGIAYSRLLHFKEAYTDYTAALNLNPNLKEAYTNRSDASNHLGLYDQAIADANQALALDPQSPYGHTNRAFAYHATQRYDEALADFEVVIGLNPEVASAYLGRGMVKQDAHNDPAGALADYEMALSIDGAYRLRAPYHEQCETRRQQVIAALPPADAT